MNVRFSLVGFTHDGSLLSKLHPPRRKKKRERDVNLVPKAPLTNPGRPFELFCSE